jgi:murein DD-endopeptidase MepM/ murein hydrolase activator NlpD
MQLIVLSRDRGQLGHLRLTSKRTWVAAFGVAFLVCGGAFYAGFRVAGMFGVVNPEAQVAQWHADLQAQEALIATTRRTVRQNLDALALRLGQMNAHIVRLDALGARLTEMAGLTDGEFDFTSAPALGGPEEPLSESDLLQATGIVTAVEDLGAQIENRTRQLGVLEDLLIDRKLQRQIQPEGRPVTSGYISSHFGNRTDPFTGRRAFHKGVDFAGRTGAAVVAVASGVVIWSGSRAGYGELVEVSHGSGYVTRYAHNADNLAAVGDMVKRGQVIARMGDTGRATGPNLHFEVLHNGRAVNPLTYIRSAD